jgi:transposase
MTKTGYIMSHMSRRDYLMRIYSRYGAASRVEKGRILGEFCTNCGYHRKYAIRLLNGPAAPQDGGRTVKRRRRGVTYGPQVISILKVRLKALLPGWMPWIRRHYALSAAAERQLLQISARSIDRRLQGEKRKLRQLQHFLEQLLRARYGPRRERVDENQLFLFAAEILAQGGNTASASKESEGSESNAKSEPRRGGHGRGALPKSLKRQRAVYDLPEDQRQCPACQEVLRRIGEEVSERLEYVPAMLVVIEEACQKYACPKGCTVVTAEKPEAPIEKGSPGPGLLAQVAVSKYGDHLPLNRQEEIFRRQGVELPRQTMCDWMRRCAELVYPLYELMKKQVLGSKAVQTDDTPVPVLDPELPRTRTGRIWTYVGDSGYTVYDYTPNRSRDGPDAFLRQFRGYLQADAYSGYDHLYEDCRRGITEVACWAHSRRKHYEAQSSDLMRSTVVLAYIRLLYDVEREAREQNLAGEARRELRQAKSKPILDDLHAYLEREQPQVLPKSPEGQAIAYTLSNWKALIRYCEDGDLEIDNNGAERSLRGVAVGRKNWLFFGSDNGGRTAAVLTSLIATCKRLGVDPFTYLRDIFQTIGSHPQTRITELLPDQWKAASQSVGAP